MKAFPLLHCLMSLINALLLHYFSGQSLKKGRGLYKHEVLEVTFQIYPPRGTGIVNQRKSTWMNPIVNGEEANKLMGKRVD